MATAATAELGIAGVTTAPLYADPYYMPEKIVENNLVKAKTTCLYPPFEGTGSSSSTPYQWEVPRDPNWWVDAELVVTGRMRVAMKHKMTGVASNWVQTNKDEIGHGTNNVKYGLIDDIAQTMWSKVGIEANGIPVYDPNIKPYPFRWKFESILNFEANKKNRDFKYSMNYIREKGGRADNTALTTASKERFNQLAKDTFTDFEVVLHTDLISMDNQIPPNNGLRLVLERSPDSFIFIQDKTWAENLVKENKTPTLPTLELKHVELKVVKSQPSTNRRRSGLAPMTMGRIREIPILPNNTIFNFTNLFRGEDLPQQVLVTLLPQKAWNGDIQYDPFHWTKPNILEAYLLVDGVDREPMVKYSNVKKGEEGYGDLDMYKSTMRAAGSVYLSRDGTLDIDKDEWSNDTFFLAFDRSPGKNNSLSTIFRPKPGQHMDLVLHLQKAMEETYIVLVYGIYKTFVEFGADGSLNRVPHIIC